MFVYMRILSVDGCSLTLIEKWRDVSPDVTFDTQPGILRGGYKVQVTFHRSLFYSITVLVNLLVNLF